MATRKTDYYSGGKRVMIDGAPCKVASWVGTLGNDKEAIEACRPRTSFKAAYYEGGVRVVKNGLPCRYSAHIADWSPWMRRALDCGTADLKESNEVERQWFILSPEAKAAYESRRLAKRLDDYRALSDNDLRKRLEWYSRPQDIEEVQFVLDERKQSAAA